MNAESNVSEKPLLLRIKGKLYDVALFANKHPGGRKVSNFSIHYFI